MKVGSVLSVDNRLLRVIGAPDSKVAPGHFPNSGCSQPSLGALSRRYYSSVTKQSRFVLCSNLQCCHIGRSAAMRPLAGLLQLSLAVTLVASARSSYEGSHSSRRSLNLGAAIHQTTNHALLARSFDLEDGSRGTVKRAQQDITWSTTPFNPTGIPLAVRSPYVSTWLWGGTHDRFGDLTQQQPSFWNGQFQH